MQEILPITFNTHNRTAGARYCLEHLLKNSRFDGGLFLYICDDRSNEGHVKALEDVCTAAGFSDYLTVCCTRKRYGYGYVLNAALDAAFESSDVALTVEDDWLLEREFNFTPLVKLLSSFDGKYAGIRVGNNDGQAQQTPAVFEDSTVVVYDFLKRRHRYNFQCMLRHRSAFRHVRFKENCSPAQAEVALKWLDVPVLMAMKKQCPDCGGGGGARTGV